MLLIADDPPSTILLCVQLTQCPSGVIRRELDQTDTKYPPLWKEKSTAVKKNEADVHQIVDTSYYCIVLKLKLKQQLAIDTVNHIHQYMQSLLASCVRIYRVAVWKGGRLHLRYFCNRKNLWHQLTWCCSLLEHQRVVVAIVNMHHCKRDAIL